MSEEISRQQLSKGFEKPPSKTRVWYKRHLNRWLRRQVHNDPENAPTKPTYRFYT